MNKELTVPTVRTEAVVTVKDAVDGTVQKKVRGKGKRPNTKTVTAITVDPRVMEQAKALCVNGKRLVIVHETEVWIVNPGSKLRPKR